MPSADPVHPLDLLSSRIDHEISAGEARYLEAHLRMCEDCRARETELRAVARALGGLQAAAPPAGASERLLEHLRTRPTAAPTPAAAEPEKPTASRSRVLALAAPVVVLAATIAIFGRGQSAPAGPPPRALPRFVVAPPPIVELPPTPAPVEPPRREVAEPEPAAARATPAPPTPEPAPAPEPIAEPQAPAPRLPIEIELSEPAVAPAAETLPFVVEFKKGAKRLPREAEQALERIAAYLNEDEQASLVVQGHGDDKGSMEKDAALGERRAEAVVRELERRGIDAARLRVVGQPGAGDRSRRVLFEATRR